MYLGVALFCEMINIKNSSNRDVWIQRILLWCRNRPIHDGAGFWTRNGIALISKLYTMGPTFTTEVTRGATNAIGNWIGGSF